MGRFHRFQYWLRQLNRSRARAELKEEIRSHLELEVREKMVAGLTEEEARREARREFGSVARVTEESYDASGFRFLETLLQDGHNALRFLRRNSGFSLAAILVLGIAIGLNVSVFSVLHAYLIRPLPFPEAGRLVSVRTLPFNPTEEQRRAVPQGLRDLAWPLQDALIEESMDWDLDVFTLVGEGRPEVASGAWVPPSCFDLLGPSPALGRFFTAADGQPGAEPVAVVSHALWQRRFGGESDVLGRAIQAYMSDRPDEAESFTIVGVLPADFWFMDPYNEILVNLTERAMPYILRLRPGVTPEQAAAHLTAIAREQLRAVDPSWAGMQVVPYQEAYVRRVQPVLVSLMIAALLVLLICCANAGLLFAVRALSRRRELSIRQALGASRGRVARMVLTEGLMLATAAGLLGCWLAWWALEVLAPAVHSQLGITTPGGAAAIAVHPPALLVALVLSAISGLVFGLVPVLTAGGADLTRSLRGGAHTVQDRFRVRDLAIGAQVAVALTLLIGANLMLQSAAHLHRIDLGFDPENVLTAYISLRQQSYVHSHQLTAFVDRCLEDLESRPRVREASMMVGWPFQDRRGEPVIAEGGSGEDARGVLYVVTPGYFDTMSVRLLEGRPFERRETQPVVIVSRSMARRLWPGSSALGRRVTLGVEGENAVWRTVVGVVAESRETLTGEDLPDTYVPYSQMPSVFLYVMAKLAGEPAEAVAGLQEAVWALDPEGAVTRVEMMSDLVDRQRLRPRFLAWLISAFSAFALVLTVLGLYSVVAYSVGQRRREVAVCMALGARSSAILGLFARAAALVVGAGVAAGLLGAIALGASLESQLYGVAALSPLTYLATALLMVATAAVAVGIPAWRATETDPARVLRQD